MVIGGSNFDSLKVATCVVIEEITRDDGLTRFSMSQSTVWRKSRPWERAWDNQGDGPVELDSVPTGEVTQNCVCVRVCLCGGGEEEDCVCVVSIFKIF